MRLIDADAFVEEIKVEIMNLYLDGMKGTPRPYSELYDIIDRINEQPTIEQPTWISCAERLPKPEENPVLAVFFNTVNSAWCHGDFWELPSGIMTENITHWMPLPEPPKGDE